MSILKIIRSLIQGYKTVSPVSLQSVIPQSQIELLSNSHTDLLFFFTLPPGEGPKGQILLNFNYMSILKIIRSLIQGYKTVSPVSLQSVIPQSQIEHSIKYTVRRVSIKLTNLATICPASSVAGSRVFLSRTRSIPTNSPQPLTSPIMSKSFMSFLASAIRYSPTSSAFCWSFSFSITSRTANDTAQDTGLPPNCKRR